MLIGALAVKCKEQTSLCIHRMTCRFWKALCGRKVRLPPSSETQLRERLKKSASSPENPQDMFCKSFLQSTSMTVVSGDKMMNKAWETSWHAKQKAHGIIPEGLRGMDKEATWGKSHSDGWVYGHGAS
jgi:hypothetical protein